MPIDKLRQGTSANKNWRTINELVEAVNMLGVQTNGTRRGIAELRIRPRDVEAGGVGELRQFRVKTINADTLTCKTWDGSSDGADDYTVYKPQQAKGTAHTVVASATVYPAYAVNTVITGFKADGATTWTDINYGGRIWCIYIDICIAGTTESVYLPLR